MSLWFNPKKDHNTLSIPKLVEECTSKLVFSVLTMKECDDYAVISALVTEATNIQTKDSQKEIIQHPRPTKILIPKREFTRTYNNSETKKTPDYKSTFMLEVIKKNMKELESDFLTGWFDLSQVNPVIIQIFNTGQDANGKTVSPETMDLLFSTLYAFGPVPAEMTEFQLGDTTYTRQQLTELAEKSIQPNGGGRGYTQKPLKDRVDERVQFLQNNEEFSIALNNICDEYAITINDENMIKMIEILLR